MRKLRYALKVAGQDAWIIGEVVEQQDKLNQLIELINKEGIFSLFSKKRLINNYMFIIIVVT